MPEETTKAIMPTVQKEMDFWVQASVNLLPMKKPKNHLTMVGRRAGQNVEASRVAGKIFGSKYFVDKQYLLESKKENPKSTHSKHGWC